MCPVDWGGSYIQCNADRIGDTGLLFNAMQSGSATQATGPPIVVVRGKVTWRLVLGLEGGRRHLLEEVGGSGGTTGQ